VLWIRIGFNADPDPVPVLDPNPLNSGLGWQKMKIFQLENKSKIFD